MFLRLCKKHPSMVCMSAVQILPTTSVILAKPNAVGVEADFCTSRRLCNSLGKPGTIKNKNLAHPPTI